MYQNFYLQMVALRVTNLVRSASLPVVGLPGGERGQPVPLPGLTRPPGVGPLPLRFPGVRRYLELERRALGIDRRYLSLGVLPVGFDPPGLLWVAHVAVHSP